MGLESDIPVLTTSLEKVVQWARRSAVWPVTFGLACCAIEMMAMSCGRYDVARFGAEVFRGSPRQADLMIVAGRVSIKMAPVLRQLYDQMPDPKWVIAMGACSSCGGVFNNYAILQGVDKIVIALVAVQWANSESGVKQPVAEVAAAVHAAGGLLLVDAAQMPSSPELAAYADFVALSAHKRGGPPGVGALLVRDLATLSPTGGQERGYRPGTENLPGVLGYAAALHSDYSLVTPASPAIPDPMTAMRCMGASFLVESSSWTIKIKL